jgi:ubiquinone biosynthesis protein
MEQFSLKDIGSDILYSSSQFISFLNKFPGELKYILKKMRKGELHYNVHYHGLEPLTQKLNSIANRLVLGMLICTLILSSTLIMNHQTTGTSYGMPLYSLIGYILAGLLSLLLGLSVLRNRRR